MNDWGKRATRPFDEEHHLKVRLGVVLPLLVGNRVLLELLLLPGDLEEGVPATPFLLLIFAVIADAEQTTHHGPGFSCSLGMPNVSDFLVPFSARRVEREI